MKSMIDNRNLNITGKKLLITLYLRLLLNQFLCRYGQNILLFYQNDLIASYFLCCRLQFVIMAHENLVTRPGNIDQINEKVLKYETFLSERLRPDLKSALEERDKLYAETAEFLALKNSIEAIKASKLLPGEPLKTKVDLGSNFYCQAVVPNPSRIIIEVGLGMLQ